MPHVNRIKILKLLIILIYVVKGWNADIHRNFYIPII